MTKLLTAPPSQFAATRPGVAATAAKAEPRRKFVVFSLDEQHYGVDIMSVREIRMAQTITYIPGSPKYICGVINLRGSIVPVCDLRARFGRGETVLSPQQRIVIALVGGRPTGLLVDEVLDIVSVLDADVTPVPQDGENAQALFSGLVSPAPDAMLIVINLDRIFEVAGHAVQE